MECGPDVELCGVVTLESGLGRGPYFHAQPVVHGIRPQVGRDGSSKCLPPDTKDDPQPLHDCYNLEGRNHKESQGVQDLEWDAYGTCAGVNASEFFTQVCELSARPLLVMRDSRRHHHDLRGIAQGLELAGYPIWSVDSDRAELHLSVCAGPDGKWHIASVEDFHKKCGARRGRCKQGLPGSACVSDQDCASSRGCTRCDESGHCASAAVLFLQGRRR